ncbi:MAG: hypothetical protein C5B50_19265 [Verrucomicrobia bacterium]|nr:MAG: hypothetical protein C5B50_19265 [Verrucomicrobiota bacterium]
MATTTEALQLKLQLSGLAQVEAGLKGVTHLVNGIDRAVKASTALLGTLAGGLGAAALIETAKHSAEQVVRLGSELNNLKNRVGATIPELIAMRRLLEDNGGSAGDVAMLMQRMERSIADAAEQGGALEKSFTDLGLSAEKLSAMPPGEAFKAIATGIASMDNEFKKTQVAMSIFGKTGAEIKQMFADLSKVEAAYSGQGAFKAAMARSAEAFHETEVAIAHFKENGLKFFTGFMDELAPLWHNFIQSIGNIDLTAIGQKFGALVGVIVQSWKDGKLPEMIALLIEAGFEIGRGAAERIIGAISWKKVGASLVNEILLAAENSAKILIDLFSIPVVYLKAGFEYLFGKIREGFQTAFNWVKVNVVAPFINSFVDKWNNTMGIITGKTFDRVSFSTSAAKPGVSWNEALLGNAAGAAMVSDAVTDQMHRMAQAQREILGLAGAITDKDNQQLTAVQRLAAMMDEYMKKREAAAKVETSPAAPPAITFGADIRRLRQAEEAERVRLVDIREKQAQLEGDFTKTDAQKWVERRELLLEEKAALQSIVDLIKARAALELQRDPNAAERLMMQANSVRGEGANVDKQIGKQGANPYSITDQMFSSFTKLQNEFGTWAQQTAKTFEVTFNAATNSISKGITEVIMKTKTWGEALREIGRTILTEVISSITKMVVEYVMGQVIIRGAALVTAAVMRMIGLEQRAQSWENFAASASAGAGKSGEQGGWVGVLIYAGVLAAVIAGIMAMSGGFAEGGFTGAGGKHDVAGLVHRGEFVMPQSAVNRIGVPALESMRQGASPAGAASSQGSGIEMHNHVWLDQNDMMKFVKSHPEMEHYFTKVAVRNRDKIVSSRG